MIDRKFIQHLKPEYYMDVERQLKIIFFKILFKPLAEAINNATKQTHGIQLENSGEDTLKKALRSGRIQYSEGAISGQFSAEIGRAARSIGATFDKRSKSYRISKNNVPNWLIAESLNYKQIARDVHETLQRELDYVQTHLDRLVDENPIDAEPAIDRVEDGFQHISQQLKVNPKLNEASRRQLSKDYSNNMKLWINNFSEEEIQKLRGVVQKNAQEGYRFESLIKGIQYRHDVSANKAKFLARQETALFMAKFRQERFGEGGIIRYQWSTAHDAKVRPTAEARGQERLNNHRILEGRIFYYKDPPIVDSATGRRANPGQDYNCRCVDIPILEVHRPHEVAA